MEKEIYLQKIMDKNMAMIKYNIINIDLFYDFY